jgi:hypothetical protein|tara:strand:- start:1392 stop:1643 length:252 start_codon:yes stop_codon:yes gene_type:complete
MITLTPDDKKRIAGAIKEISDSMTRMDAEKELITDIIKVTHENHGVDKKHVRKLASIYHKSNMAEVRTENDDIDTLYEELFNG